VFESGLRRAERDRKAHENSVGRAGAEDQQSRNSARDFGRVAKRAGPGQSEWHREHQEGIGSGKRRRKAPVVVVVGMK